MTYNFVNTHLLNLVEYFKLHVISFKDLVVTYLRMWTVRTEYMSHHAV